MQNNWMNIDLKNVFDTLKDNIRSLGGFSPEQVRQAGRVDENALRSAIIRALADGPKPGTAVMEFITSNSATSFKPNAGSIYPMLELLSDEGLITSTFKKDRKIYSLTVSGKELNSELPLSPDPDSESSDLGWSAPKWVDLRGAVPVSLTRLGKVSVEVAKHGSKEQQEAAAKAIDEARRKLHEILAAE